MNINTPTKLILTIIIIGLIGAVFYFTTYQVQIKEIGVLKTELETKKAKLEEVKQRVQELPQLITRREELRSKVDKELKETLVQEEARDFVPNYLSQIEELVKEVSVKTADKSFELIELRPGATSVEQAPQPQGAQGKPPSAADQKKAEEKQAAEAVFSSFPTRTFEMSMKGRYNTLIEFLTQLGELKLKRLVTINRIGLSPGGESAKGGSPVLSITIPVTAYLRQMGGGQ